MRISMFLLGLLLSTGVSAQPGTQLLVDRQVKVDFVKGVVLGLEQDEVTQYSGMTADGYCFVITRQAGEWDTTSYRHLYEGKCTEELRMHRPAVIKSRNMRGTINFSFDLHVPPGYAVVINSPEGAPNKYKMKPAQLLQLK